MKKKRNWLIPACGAATLALAGVGIYDIQMDHIVQGQTLLGCVVPLVGYLLGKAPAKLEKGGETNDNRI
jgi:hypothetical protein